MNSNKEIVEKEKRWTLNSTFDISKEIVSNVVNEVEDITNNILNLNVDSEELLTLSKELIFYCILLVEDTSKLISPCHRAAIIGEFKRAFCLNLFEMFFNSSKENAKEFEYFFTVFETEYYQFKKELDFYFKNNISTKKLIAILVSEFLNLKTFSGTSFTQKEQIKKQLIDLFNKKNLPQLSFVLFS